MQNAVLVSALVTAFVLQAAPAHRSEAVERYERLRMLNEPLKDPARADVHQVRDLLVAALADPDESVRTAAVDIIGSFRGRVLMFPMSPDIEDWRKFVPLCEELRPQIVAALNDPSSRVRGKAVYALTNTDVRVISERPMVVQVPPELARILERQFSTDQAPGVRSRIANFFGLIDKTNQGAETLSIVRSVLLKALRDPDPYVVQFAGSAMFRWRIPEALLLLVEQLKNPSHVARMGVSAGLQGYGAEARPYLPQMEEALTKEPEGPTRKTLEATIRRVREGRSPNRL